MNTPTAPTARPDDLRPSVVCCCCGRARSRTGKWVVLEGPFAGLVSHTICPLCVAAHYPEYADAVTAAPLGGAT